MQGFTQYRRVCQIDEFVGRDVEHSVHADDFTSRLYWPPAYNGRMFCHLRLHTEFSVVDGTTRIDEVVQAAAASGQPALAITDLNNLFGTVKFYRQARARGVKPLIGAEVLLEGMGSDPAATSRMVLLVQTSRVT